MKQFFFTTALIGMIGLSSGAQDGKFSQYEAAPLLLNPALSGKFDGNLRFGAVVSLQRAEPAALNHATGFVDFKGTNSKGTYGLGVSYYQNGHNEFQLTSKYISFAAAQHLKLDAQGVHTLSLGAQVAFARGVANTDKPYYDPVLSGGGFTISEGIKTGETKSYADFNAGFVYTYKGQGFAFETGAAAYHVFGPDISFDSTNGGRRRVDFTANATIQLHPMTKMHLSTLIWKEGLYWKAGPRTYPEFDAIYGVLLESQNSSESSILYGLSTRFANTFIVKGGVNYKRVRLLASYERPIQDDTYSVRRGELSALFTL